MYEESKQKNAESEQMVSQLKKVGLETQENIEKIYDDHFHP